MVGWVLFDEGDPAHFGDIGEAMLTMFIGLTLENLPDNIERGGEITAWAVPVLRLVRAAGGVPAVQPVHRDRDQLARGGAGDRARSGWRRRTRTPHDRVLAERVRELRRIVDELEREIAARGP